VASLHADESGTSLIEFTVVFPLTVLVILGTVDAALLMFDWSSATKATYAGARTAVLTDPVAKATHFNLSSYTTQSTYSGRYCFDASNGNADATAACPTFSFSCTGDTTSGGGSCTGSTNSAFDKAAFDTIFAAVQQAYPYRTLDRGQVKVSYATTNLGFVGQQSFNGGTGELPMNVSVELRCITHEFFFVAPFVRWAFPNLPQTCRGITTGTEDGMIMPPFYTTLPSEDLATN
jgi:Flp pilus assembly protein TadG